MAPVVPPASSGCTEASKRARAATLRGLASAFSGSSSKPEQPEPPTYAAALPTAWNPDGVRGNRRFCDSPGRSLVLSRERESTRPTKDKQQKSSNLHRLPPMQKGASLTGDSPIINYQSSHHPGNANTPHPAEAPRHPWRKAPPPSGKCTHPPASDQ